MTNFKFTESEVEKAKIADAPQNTIRYVEGIDQIDYHDGFIRLGTSRNAIDYLEKANQFITQMKSDKMAFKWVAISLHGALYCYAAFKAASIHGHNATTNINENSKPPHLKNIWALLALTSLGTFYEERKWAVEMVVDAIRNNTQHPIPSAGMAINNRLLLKDFHSVLDIIKALITSCSWFNAESYSNYKRQALEYIVGAQIELKNQLRQPSGNSGLFNPDRIFRILHLYGRKLFLKDNK